MAFQRDEDPEVDDTFDQVTSMADRLGLKGKQRATYIDDHMTGLGYEPVQSRESYVRPKPPDDEGRGGGNRWGIGRRAGNSGVNGGDDPDRF